MGEQKYLEEAKKFILDVLAKYGLQEGYYIDIKWIWLSTPKASLIVKKYWKEALNQLCLDEVIEERNDKLYLTKHGEDVLLEYCMNENCKEEYLMPNITINPTFNQTQTQTQMQNITQEINDILRRELSADLWNELQGIIKEQLPQEDKKSKIMAFLGNCGSGVLSRILASVITGYYKDWTK